MTPPYPIPHSVREAIRGIFTSAAGATATLMSQAPSTYEETLDMSLVTALAAQSLPLHVDPGWILRFQTHFLGGRRHHYNWEIADLAVIILFRVAGRTRRTKVVLMQSKRLYPIEQDHDELTIGDYLVGMGRLAVPDDPWAEIIAGKTLTFSGKSEYKALRKDDRQYESIAEYETAHGVPVYYLLYNPRSVPHQVRTPVDGPVDVAGACTAGARVFRSPHLRSLGEPLTRFTFADLEGTFTDSPMAGTPAGWRLEDFVADLAVDCHEGYHAASPEEPGLQRIFTRRAGPISSAVSIIIDAPDGV